MKKKNEFFKLVNFHIFRLFTIQHKIAFESMKQIDRENDVYRTMQMYTCFDQEGPCKPVSSITESRAAKSVAREKLSTHDALPEQWPVNEVKVTMATAGFGFLRTDEFPKGS